VLSRLVKVGGRVPFISVRLAVTLLSAEIHCHFRFCIQQRMCVLLTSVVGETGAGEKLNCVSHAGSIALRSHTHFVCTRIEIDAGTVYLLVEMICKQCGLTVIQVNGEGKNRKVPYSPGAHFSLICL